MSNVFDTLKERGFIAQMTHENEIRELLQNNKVTFYIGFDPTADSLHIGHFLPLMAMAHMQRAGHRPIALLGCGTAMVGDPSGKTDMRKMLTRETLMQNAEEFKKQMSRYIHFDDGQALMLDNSEWLLELNYVEFLRNIGVHFSVNRMLTADCFKIRLEKGLSFLEFNYMLMQSYDFLTLFRNYGCNLQLGGDDQWSNIIGGIELIRKTEGKEAYGMTFNLITTSEGKKMGKTEKGALWLDAKKTSPYEFYQYWRNIDDPDVIKCLKLLTFLSMDEIKEYEKMTGSELNKAKKTLAYEVTRLVHGMHEADKAMQASEALFTKGTFDDNMPSADVASSDIENGINILELLFKAGLIPSKGEGRRLILQGGLYLNDARIESHERIVGNKDFNDGISVVRIGKKKFHRLILTD
ncbi:MAG: tyrosine--tRNA ligase [Eubacteriales bacterium]|nr:tyrosine--tRNA ligase [Eubacteriales bacterium]